MKAVARSRLPELLALLAMPLVPPPPPVEVMPEPGGNGARLVVREISQLAGVDLAPFELAEISDQLLDAGGRKAKAKREIL